MAGSFAGAAKDDLVAILEEGAGFAGGEKDGSDAVSREFEEAASGGFRWPGDSSSSKDVADLKVAPIAGVVGDQLRGCPVKILRVGLT
jgi:hypothetical protein